MVSDRPKCRYRMRRMKATMAGVIEPKSLGQDADMGGCFPLVEPRARRSDDTPGHRRHYQGAVMHVIEQALDERLGAEPLSSKRPEGAVNEEHAITRRPCTVEHFGDGAGLPRWCCH